MKNHVPLDMFLPNPWQTREGDPDPIYIKDLAMDIAANGMLQTPTGRLVRPNGEVLGNEADYVVSVGWHNQEPGARVQLAFGHNRLEAFRWLYDLRDNSNIPGDFSKMPVELRPLTDEQMALMAWSENEKRRDVTPIERAKAIQRRIEAFGWSQKEAAEALGISRPVVSNALRLLDLPAEVQAGMAEGKISERQALVVILWMTPEENIKQEGDSNEWPTRK